MNTIKKVAAYDIPRLMIVAHILNKCGKDMAKKYDLHHWDNPYIKTFAIVCLCVLKGNEIYLIYSDNKPVSTVQVNIKNDILHAEKGGTLPSEAGKGIGSLGLETTVKIASERGCRKVIFEVYSKSEHALSFFKHRGFKVAGVEKTSKYELFKMEKDIQ